MEQKIREWTRVNLQHVTVTNPISVHLNDLLPTALPRSETLTQSMEAFNILTTQLIEIGMPARPLLVIPLRAYAQKLTMALPLTIEDLDRQIDDYEPPSLYLLDWKPIRSAVVCEEYCAPLQIDLAIVDEKVYVYYREFRYGLAIQNNWEFSRAVYFEYFPDGLLIQ